MKKSINKGSITIVCACVCVRNRRKTFSISYLHFYYLKSVSRLQIRVFFSSHRLLVGATQTHSSPLTVQLWLSWVSQKLSLVFNSNLSLILGLSIFLHFISFSVRSPNLSICSVLLKALHMFVLLPKRVLQAVAKDCVN